MGRTRFARVRWIKKGKEKTEALTEDEVGEMADRSNQLMKDAIQSIEQELEPKSKEVQRLMKRYYDLLSEFSPVTHEIFLKLRNTVPDQREVYAAYHPKLPEFLYEAMDEFARTFF
jgi:hypothetical protein